MKNGIKGIFIWEVESGQEKEFEKRWKENSDKFQTYQGARGTKLHRSADHPSIYAGYASWDSIEDRARAAEQMNRDYPDLKNTDEISKILYSGFFHDPEITADPR